MRTLHFRGAALGLIGVTALLAACEADRAISSQQTGDVAYGTQLVLTAGTPSYNFPRGTVRFRQANSAPTDSAVTDTIVVTLQGLDSLEAGFYTIWAGNRAGNKWKRLTGDLVVTRFDTTLNAQGDPVQVPVNFNYPNLPAFAVGGARQRTIFTTDRTKSGLTSADTVHVVLVSIEATNTAATAPSETRRPLWALRGSTTSGSSTTRNMAFGFYKVVTVGTAVVDSSYVYVPTGRGRTLIRGSTIVVSDSGLGAPPMGYFYAAWAVRRDTFYVTRPKTTGTGVDTVAKLAPDTVYLGAQTTPFPDRKSLFDADMSVIDAAIQITSVTGTRSILSAANRFDIGTVTGYSGIDSPLQGFQFINVTLESKNADAPGNTEAQTRMGPAVLLQAPVHAAVRTPRT